MNFELQITILAKLITQRLSTDNIDKFVNQNKALRNLSME